MPGLAVLGLELKTMVGRHLQTWYAWSLTKPDRASKVVDSGQMVHTCTDGGFSCTLDKVPEACLHHWPRVDTCMF